MRRHAEEEYPLECCGALLGHSDNGARRVAAVEPLGNRRDSGAAQRRFLISGDDYRGLESGARARSLDILGFYHSHPDHPAQPSQYDREHALPWYSYVIIAVENGRATNTASWIFQDDRSSFQEEEIESPGMHEV